MKIRRGIFEGDSLSPLLFVLAVIPLSIMLRKVKARYDLGGNKGSVNYFLFMDDLNLYEKNKRQLDTLANSVRIFSEDVQMQFEISKCVILIMRGRGEMCIAEVLYSQMINKLRKLKLIKDLSTWEFLRQME